MNDIVTYTYIFSTHDDGINSPINGVYEIPMNGFSSEDEAYDAFTSLPFYEESPDGDLWMGSVISYSIKVKQTRKQDDENGVGTLLPS